MEKSRPPKKNFTVAIVGGGIGGLTLATGLLRRNVPVQIYEAASAFREVGLGLSIGPAAHRIMPLIDPRIREIYDSFITTHADSPGYEKFRQTWFQFVWATGEKAGQILIDLKALPSGQTTVRRSDFLDGLVSLVPSGIAHFGKRLERITETKSRVDMLFEDGTSASADVVIGCDGIHSKVKEHVVPGEYKDTLPRYSGMYGYRAILDTEVLVNAVGQDRAKVSTIYIGQGAYVITYPIMRAKKINVGLYVLSPEWDSESLVRPASKSDMRRDLNHMGQYVNAIMDVSCLTCEVFHIH
jgi:salicylate hydroxylase